MEEIYRQYHQWLLRLTYRLTGSWDIAEDVVHDVFLKLARQNETVRSVKSWLAKSVTNCALDYKRLAWFRLRGYLKDWEHWPAVFRDSYAERDAINHILKKLTPKERAVMVLRDMEGYPVKEIAEMLHLAPATVRVFSKNGRDKFVRLYLQEFDGERDEN